MKAFADLYTALDETTKTGEKVEALTRYFAQAPAADAAWAVYFLIGRKPRQAVPSGKLRVWAAEEAGVPDWLFEESYDAVGDVAETIALLLPPPERSSDVPLRDWVEGTLLPLRECGRGGSSEAVLAAWRAMDRPQRFVWNKLITGAFRVGVSQQLVTRALGRSRGSSRRSSRTGSWATGSRPRRSSSRCTRRIGRRRHQPPVSVLPGPCAGGRPRDARRPVGLAGRVEVGRHPLAAHPARRADLPLVARRGAGHRTLSRAGRRGRPAPRGHRPRRRDPARGRRAAPCPSRSCSGGSAARRSARRSSPRSPWSWWPTTCSKTGGSTSALAT